MITYDGHRSLRRKHLGRRVLENITKLGLPAKAVLFDGFLVKALNLDDVKKARITAPAGALVACSQVGGVKLIELDHWLGGAESMADAYICNAVFLPGQVASTYNNPNYIWPKIMFVPEAIYDQYTYTHINLPPQIGLLPFLGENYVLTMTGSDNARNRTESLMTPYLLAGNADRRIAVASEFTTGAMESIHTMPGKPYRIAGTRTGKRPISAAGNKYICATVYFIEKDRLGYFFFFANTMYAGVPDATMRSRMIIVQPTDLANTVGSYIYALSADVDPTLLTVVDARDAAYGLTGVDEWKLFYAFHTYGSGSLATIPLSSFVSTLNNVDPLHAVGTWPSVDIGRAYEVLSQLIGWPMRRENLPPDTVTFHGPSGDVYTWSRRYGAVKFATTGLTTTTLTLPAEVTGENGVRPELSYAGNDLYLCVCNKPGKSKLPSEYADQAEADADWCGIKAIYRGSPFSGWTAIAMPDAAYRLHHVRPIEVSANAITLLGVLRTMDAQPVYYLAAFRDGAWTNLGKLPVTVADPERVSWTAALFGDDPLVASMAAFPSPPAITPQMPALPYSVYTGVIP